MSWSFSVPETPGEEFPDAVRAAATTQIDAIRNEWTWASDGEKEASCKQVAAAARAAGLLYGTGTIGPPSHRFGATLSGHANPGHGPRDGFANDVVTVSIYQATEAGE
jgi:hypothetical protein